MCFLGNLNGPKKSELFAAQEPSYFGITSAELAVAVDEYITDEAANEVAPVQMNRQNHFYIIVNAPNFLQQHLYIPATRFTGRIRVLVDGDQHEKEIDVGETILSA